MENSVLEGKDHSGEIIANEGNGEGNDNPTQNNVDAEPLENTESVSEENAEKVSSAASSNKEVEGENVIVIDQKESSIAPSDIQQENISQHDIVESSQITDANVDTLDKIPSGTIDKTPSGTIDKKPSGTIDKIPSGTIDKIPSGTIDKIPETESETDAKISEDSPSKDIVNKDVSETDDVLKEDTNLKIEDAALLRVESDKSQRSLGKSSRESLTIHSDKEAHEGIKTVASYEDLKELSITSEGSARSQININEETSSELASPQKDSSFPRTEIIEKCRNLLAEIRQLRLKNILLQKKLHDYFKRKKAEGTYREGESVLGSLAGAQAELHYRKNLLMLEDVLDNDAAERIKIDSESKELLHAKTELLDDAVTQIDLLLEQEETFGHGLIYSQTGKVLPDKVVLLLINRQKQVIKQLSETMLKYIRLKDAVAEKETAIKALEDLGEGLHLIDYEELCVEKRALSEKNEERDNDLSHLREKIETSILALSHIHEKAHNTDQLIQENLDRLINLNHLVQESREIRTKAKKYLNNLRSEIDHLQREAGLLIHHSLLRDFENVLMKISEVEKEVNIMKKNSIEEKSKRISVLNSNMDVLEKWNYERGLSSFNEENGAFSYPEKYLDNNPAYDKSKARQPSNPDARLGHPYSRIRKGRPSIVKFLPNRL